MDDYKHTDLLILQSAELAGRTPFCPEDQEIASYFDGGMLAYQGTVLERHLADCSFCLARIGILNHLQTEGDSAPVSETELAAAKRLDLSVPARPWRRTGQWAAAAVLVLALASAFTSRLMMEQTPGATSMAAPADYGRQLRSIERNPKRLEVVIDNPPGAVTAGSTVRWAEVRNPIHYNVYLLSVNGDVLFTARTRSNEWVLHSELQLTSGEDYFLRVEAVLADGDTVNSSHIHFTAAGWQ